MTPARVTPMPLAYDSASARALPVASWWTASSAGVPRAFDVQLADAVARRLRRDHRHVDVLARHDRAEADVEAVREHQHLARRQVRLDVVLVQLRLRWCPAPAS